MYILGYSGLSHAFEYRKEALDDLASAEYDYCQGMDAAATLIYEGKVIAAAEEERFNGEKHTHAFPTNAINFCLQQANITIDDVAYIAHGFDYDSFKHYFMHEPYSLGFYEQAASSHIQKQHLNLLRPDGGVDKKFVAVKHHDAHAASTFYPSRFEDALVVVADGIGEVHSISVYHGKYNQLHLLKSYDFLSSIGMFYGLVTQHLGFKINSGEYKVMGLAPYGNPTRFKDFMAQCIELKPNGRILVNAFLKDKTALEKHTYRGLFRWLTENTITARQPEEEIAQVHKDLAAALQQRFTQAMMHILQYWQAQTEANNLCLAGGVAFNCATNGEVLKSGMFEDIYIQPAAGDAGTSLGAALFQYYQTLNNRRGEQKQELPLYGPHLSRNVKLEVLDSHKTRINYQELTNEELYERAAQMIVDGKVIGWMQGHMEFGPRALGNRSILGDPRRPEMRDKINSIIKKREGFRPFAPSVKASAASQYFAIDDDKEFPYMLFVVPVREEYQQQLPAVTHVNGTARIQTVTKAHKRYWKLLDAFEKKTQLPVLLNTSFNVRGQPIVCTIADAVSTFLHTELDAMFVGNFLVTKK